MAMPTAVIAIDPTSARPASASNRPVSALARCTGSTHSRLSKPDARSSGMAAPAPIAPNSAPTTAHIGTSP
jgi:hypothetical protein